MVLHRNAKLGLAGRFALVRALEDGCSLKAAAAPSASRRQRRVAGRSVGVRRAHRSARVWHVRTIARAGRGGSAAAVGAGAATDLCSKAPHRLGAAAFDAADVWGA
jgi:hypothetical protein